MAAVHASDVVKSEEIVLLSSAESARHGAYAMGFRLVQRYAELFFETLHPRGADYERLVGSLTMPVCVKAQAFGTKFGEDHATKMLEHFFRVHNGRVGSFVAAPTFFTTDTIKSRGLTWLHDTMNTELLMLQNQKNSYVPSTKSIASFGFATGFGN